MHISDLEKANTLHHAYLVTASHEAAVIGLLSARGVPTKNNPDLLVQSYTDLSVDDARAVSHFAHLHSVNGTKYLVLSFGKASDAAQNALLKVVEEAPGNSVFFFCTPHLAGILETLRSRCIHVHGDSKTEETAVTQLAKEFFLMSYKERLEAVETIVSEQQKTEDRSLSRSFVETLLREAHRKHKSASVLRTIVDAQTYLSQQGTSAKAVLSHLAVVV